MTDGYLLKNLSNQGGVYVNMHFLGLLDQRSYGHSDLKVNRIIEKLLEFHN